MLKHLYHPLLTFIFLGVTACGGAPDKTYEDIPDLALSGIVINGAAVVLEDGKTGLYEIHVSSSTDTVSVAVTANEDHALYYSFSSAQDSVTNESVASGETFELHPDLGSNLFYVSILNESSQKLLTYSFKIFRESSQAGLGYWQFYSDSTQEETVSSSPSFSSEIYDYSIAVDYGICVLYSSLSPLYSDNTITVDSEEIESGELFSRHLEPGENILDVFARTSSGEQQVRYSALITRAQPTDAQWLANARLASLEIENVEMDFLCSESVYSISVDSDSEYLALTPKPEVDGVTMEIGDQRLTPGEINEIPLSEGDSTLILQLTALDGTSTKAYAIYVDRLQTNRTRVSNAVQLQDALRNANPNDEILLSPGVYESVQLEENAFFYTGRSGTSLHPIYITAEDPDEDTILTGHTQEGSIGLLLAGDHWRVSGVSISNASTGIALNSASHNRFFAVSVTDCGQALHVQPGSNYNSFDNAEFTCSANNNTQALVTLSGDSSNIATGNSFQRSLFQSTGNTTALHLSQHTTATLVESNRFEQSQNENTSQPQIRILGDDATVRFNSFYAENTESTTALISVGDTNTDTRNAFIYQNWLISAHPERPLVHSEQQGDVNVTENFARDAIALKEEYNPAVYSGTAVVEDHLAPPQYTIRIAESRDNCLGLESADSFTFAVIEPCDASLTQRWELEIASDYFVYIKNASASEYPYLMPPPSFANYCESLATATSITFLSDLFYGYAQQWAIYNLSDDQVAIANRQDSDYGLTISGTTFTEGNPAVVCPLVERKRQTFIFEEI